MYAQMLKQVWCFIAGHRWNWVNAIGEPDLGATCFRCGKTNQKR